MHSEVMTIKQVAAYLQLNVTTVYRLAQARQIPAVKVGRVWRFHKERIDTWLINSEESVSLSNGSKDKK